MIFEKKTMVINSEKLITDLIGKTKKNIKTAEKFNNLHIEKLNWRFDKNSWSILECFEHLNLYGDFYIPEIQKKIDSSTTKPKENFKSGILGNYFAKSLQPKEELNKMKTFKDKNPIGNELNNHTIERFILQQEQILKLLNKSKKIDLNKIKTAISISNLIKLKIGDTFRVLIYHNERHLIQANNILLKINC
ncbi:DinB family protein [Tenacibaculum sp. ZS6-P6]|uniref:DinB family protein n=1 Tax=Tenacibaculum sp. ZS6-P6 TaxID=3447503 RepID=UPI003F9C4854